MNPRENVAISSLMMLSGQAEPVIEQHDDEPSGEPVIEQNDNGPPGPPVIEQDDAEHPVAVHDLLDAEPPVAVHDLLETGEKDADVEPVVVLDPLANISGNAPAIKDQRHCFICGSNGTTIPCDFCENRYHKETCGPKYEPIGVFNGFNYCTDCVPPDLDNKGEDEFCYYCREPFLVYKSEADALARLRMPRGVREEDFDPAIDYKFQCYSCSKIFHQECMADREIYCKMCVCKICNKYNNDVAPSKTPLPDRSFVQWVMCETRNKWVHVDCKNRTASHIVGYPRMGPKRELKFALESFWDGESSSADLQKVSSDLRASMWKQIAAAGIKYIPSNTFSYYDQVLDTTAMLGAVPERFKWSGGEIGFDMYFSMARGNASVPAMEMTKWFDTNYHFIVPELGPDSKFNYAYHKAIIEYKEAKALGIETVPVIIGPFSYLLLSKPAKGVEKNFPLLSLLDKILPIYKEVIAELKDAGASWIQFDEPTLVLDLEPHQLEAFTKAYSELESTPSGVNILVETYFADITDVAYKALTSLKGVTGFGFDLERGSKTLELIKREGFPSGKYLFAGVVDGRNIWANDLSASLSTLQTLKHIVGEDKLVVSTSCSLLHTPVDIEIEKFDPEIKSWLAFAAQKLLEVNALAKALAGQKNVKYFYDNAAAQASRKSSLKVNNEAVQRAAAALRGSDHRRATTVSTRLEAQHKKLNLPILPITTVGSFPQTAELRRVRYKYKKKKISEEEYKLAIEQEIHKVVELQEELDINILVHGEPERNDMVEYFGEQLSGFAFTANGWVQCYGSRCVKPPIIYGDVSRPNPMTVFWSSKAQSMTKRPMKGMLTGPVTILNWSFVRNDQPRDETCYQIALAIKDEVEDLEKAAITVIQIDEAALREGLPLRKSEQASYLDWAVHSFRMTNCGVKDTTQIHTHICYSNFNDIINSITNMDADVISIENSRSDEKLLSVFREGVTYAAGIGPGVYDIHSPRIPSMEEIADKVNKMLAVLDKDILWVNPDCGLKTCKYTEVKPALQNMVSAAKQLRVELANTK